jgi:hypothetical protein
MDIIQQAQQAIDDLKAAEQNLKDELRFLHIAILATGTISLITLIMLVTGGKKK